MRIADLDLDPRVRQALEAAGYDELYPSQVEAAPLAAAGKSFVAAVPTASGKSLLAYIALLARAAAGARGIYIVPLRALASEKHREIVALAKPLGLRVALATGDLDRPDPRLQDFDIVVCTSEKADSLIRQRTHWIDRIGCIVADEVHLLHDPSRGPTLEVLLARFRHLISNAQLIALSATVANSKEIAEWLDAAHITSTWRPVPLKEGVLYGNAITFTDNSVREVPVANDPLDALAEDTLAEGGQVMVFLGTRKSAEAAATRLASIARRFVPAASQVALVEASADLSSGPSNAIRDRLLTAVASGAAFHHAGLASSERELVEHLFLAGHLRVLTATPTLAAGLNLPARRVIIRDLSRFDSDLGRTPIPVLEYKQMAGRAGRPRFDPYGEAVTIAKTMDEREEIQFRYLHAGPEAITSKLAQDWALRTHILASIASRFANTEQGVHEFIGETLYAHQNESWRIDQKVDQTLDFLVKEKFVEDAKALRATPFGDLTSQLYIDPASAVVLRDALQASPDEPKTRQLLHAICAAPDMRTFFLRRNDTAVEEAALDLEEEVLAPWQGRTSFDQYLAEVKTALVLEDWTEEASDDELFQKFGAYPGDVHARVDTARWLLYAARDLCKLFAPPLTRPIARLELRVRHGAKEELLPLLRLESIGRYRARNLFSAGFTTVDAVRAAPVATLLAVKGMGPATVQRLKEQLGQPADVPEEPPARGQMTLGGSSHGTRKKKPARTRGKR